jgi:hypothetical protein
MKLEESGCWNGCCSWWSSVDDDMLEGTKCGVERAQYPVDIPLNFIAFYSKETIRKGAQCLKNQLLQRARGLTASSLAVVMHVRCHGVKVWSIFHEFSPMRD